MTKQKAVPPVKPVRPVRPVKPLPAPPAQAATAPAPSAAARALDGRDLELRMVDPRELIPHPDNPRDIDPEKRAALKRGIETLGFVDPIVARAEDYLVLGGHQRLDIVQELGWHNIPVTLVKDVSDIDALALLVLLNNADAQGEWALPKLADVMAKLAMGDIDTSITGFSVEKIAAMLDPGDFDGSPAQGPEQLATLFGVAPFSVLNAREGWWQDRKRAWLALGIESELGRGEGAVPGGSHVIMVNPKTGKIAHSDGRGRIIPGTDAKRSRKATAIPGGGTGKNSAYLFKTPAGYKNEKQRREMK